MWNREAFISFGRTHAVGILSAGLGAVFLGLLLAGFVSAPLPLTPGGCHAAMHEKGEKAYAANFDTPEAGLVKRPSDAASCGWGYYHAYLEALFEDHPDPLVVAGICDTIAEGEEDAPAVRRVCFGSAGSGFVRALLGESQAPVLSDAYAKTPLVQCASMDEVPEFGRQACVAGVFGELLYRSVASSTTARPPASALLQWCAPYTGDVQVECYRKAGAALFLSETDYSFVRLAMFAAAVPGLKAQKAFFVEGAEVFLLDPARRLSGEEFLLECSVNAPEKGWCIDALVRGTFDASVAPMPEKDVIAACRSNSITVRGIERQCYEQAFVFFEKIYTHVRLQQLCAATPEAFRYLCARK